MTQSSIDALSVGLGICVFVRDKLDPIVRTSVSVTLVNADWLPITSNSTNATNATLL
jgi:hypothetical protein